MKMVTWAGLGMLAGIASVYLMIGWVPIESDWANVAATLLGAIATFLAAVVALFWPTIQQRCLFPRRLEIRLRSSKTFLEDIDGQNVRYVHLEVLNHHIEYPVENVRVYVDQVEFREPNLGIFKTGPIPLTWQFEKVEGASTDRAAVPHTLGMNRICDLGFLTKETNRFTLSTAHRVANFSKEIESKMSVTVRVFAAGDNAQSRPILIDLEWDGGWSFVDDEMASTHLKIKQSSAG